MAYSNEAVTTNPCTHEYCNQCYLLRFLPDPSMLYPEDVKAVCTYDATILATGLPNEDFQVEIPECCPREKIPLLLEPIEL